MGTDERELCYRKEVFTGTCRLTRMDRVRCEGVRSRVGVRNNVSDEVLQITLKWFGHVERKSEEWLTRGVYKSCVKSKSDRGMPYLQFLVGEKKAWHSRLGGLTGTKIKCTDKSSEETFRMVQKAV